MKIEYDDKIPRIFFPINSLKETIEELAEFMQNVLSQQENHLNKAKNKFTSETFQP